ncbi:MAG: type II toxin-antitoxin system Phd/YefM family antitoxin [Promethearchaeota archaeon]|jgi:prevent-host-death family protein
MIKSISIRELRPNISKVVKNIHEKFDRYVISRRGKPEVIMLSVEDYESLLETIEIQSDKDLMKRIKRSDREISQGKVKALEEIHRELDIV